LLSCIISTSSLLVCLFFQLGVVLLEQGKASQALAYLDKALELEPEHEQALLNSAILLQELGAADLRNLARQRLLKLLDKDGKCYLLIDLLITITITHNYVKKFCETLYSIKNIIKNRWYGTIVIVQNCTLCQSLPALDPYNIVLSVIQIDQHGNIHYITYNIMYLIIATEKKHVPKHIR
jgi:tetratricopeptide (TPR) repeat protein